MGIDVIGVDGDDTLWHSEGHFHVTEQRFVEILEPWVDAGTVSSALLDTERRNLALFGYGVKGFTLSMIETALTLSGHQVDATRIERILSLGKELLAHPVELLDGVAETLDVLRRDRLAVDRHQRLRRLLLQQFLRHLVAQLDQRAVDEVADHVPVGLLRVAVELGADGAGAVADGGGLGAEARVVDHFLDVAEAVGPVAEAITC